MSFSVLIEALEAEGFGGVVWSRRLRGCAGGRHVEGCVDGGADGRGPARACHAVPVQDQDLPLAAAAGPTAAPSGARLRPLSATSAPAPAPRRRCERRPSPAPGSRPWCPAAAAPIWLGPRLAAATAPTLLIVGGRDEVVLDLNRGAQAELRCENHLAVVPGASHLFEEPGTLDIAAGLARDWFISHLTP